MLPIGGGRDYPLDEGARKRWIEARIGSSGLSGARIDTLLKRYGTTADAVIVHIRTAGEAPLAHLADYSDAEIDWISRNEMVEHLADIVMRRTTLAIEGRLSMAVLDEISLIAAKALEWNEVRRSSEVTAIQEQLATTHRMRL